MWAPAILPLARTRRLAIVASGTSSALAISAVDSPQSVRRLSATRASSAERRMAAREDQPQLVVAPTVSGSGDGSPPNGSMVVPPCPTASFAPQAVEGRLRATTVSQARGLSGTPSRGHAPGRRRPRPGRRPRRGRGCRASGSARRDPPRSTRIVSASGQALISLVPSRAPGGPRRSPARPRGSAPPSGSPRRGRRTRGIEPPSTSLVSANGPSLVTTSPPLPPCTRTVVAVLVGWSA